MHPLKSIALFLQSPAKVTRVPSPPCPPHSFGLFEVEFIPGKVPINLPCSFVDKFIKNLGNYILNFYQCRGGIRPLSGHKSYGLGLNIPCSTVCLSQRNK